MSKSLSFLAAMLLSVQCFAQTPLPARQVSVRTNGWANIAPTSETAQAALDWLDAESTSVGIDIGGLNANFASLNAMVGTLNTNFGLVSNDFRVVAGAVNTNAGILSSNAAAHNYNFTNVLADLFDKTFSGIANWNRAEFLDSLSLASTNAAYIPPGTLGSYFSLTNWFRDNFVGVVQPWTTNWFSVNFSNLYAAEAALNTNFWATAGALYELQGVVNTNAGQSRTNALIANTNAYVLSNRVAFAFSNVWSAFASLPGFTNAYDNFGWSYPWVAEGTNYATSTGTYAFVPIDLGSIFSGIVTNLLSPAVSGISNMLSWRDGLMDLAVYQNNTNYLSDTNHFVADSWCTVGGFTNAGCWYDALIGTNHYVGAPPPVGAASVATNVFDFSTGVFTAPSWGRYYFSVWIAGYFNDEFAHAWYSGTNTVPGVGGSYVWLPGSAAASAALIPYMVPTVGWAVLEEGESIRPAIRIGGEGISSTNRAYQVHIRIVKMR